MISSSEKKGCYGDWLVITGCASQIIHTNILLYIWCSLTRWGWVTHICISTITIIGSDNGLSPGRHQAIIWPNAEMLLIGSLRIDCSEILIKINTISFKKMHLKMSFAKWHLFHLSPNVLNPFGCWSSICAGQSLCLQMSQHLAVLGHLQPQYWSQKLDMFSSGPLYTKKRRHDLMGVRNPHYKSVMV